MATAQFPGDRVFDWKSLHEVSREVFGFPSFYGINLDAWIDCLSYLDDGMSRFDLRQDEDLNIELLASAELQKRAPEVFQGLIDSVEFINQRNVEVGERARIQLALL